MKLKLREMQGKKFGRLLVIGEHNQCNLSKKLTMFECECVCGNRIAVAGYRLRNGHTKSCGCLRLDIVSSHKMSKTNFYKIWISLSSRCNKTNDKRYKDYGGRGIKCLWKSFEQFRDDMYESYKEHVKKYGRKNTSIDRIDNDGNYCKKNCRWATWEEQYDNMRKTVKIKYKNKMLTLKQWSEKTGISRHTLYCRLYRGWGVERCLNTPKRF